MMIDKLMSRPAATCKETDSLNIAAQLMWEHDCGVVPVIDDHGFLVGVVTDRDICMAAYTKGVALSSIPVGDAMAKRVFSCQASDDLEYAENLMTEKQIRRVPIVDKENRPIGMLSLNDIARHAAATRTHNGMDHELVRTFAAICHPRSSSPQIEHAA